MTENRVRHLPVVDDERVIGVLSIGDLVRAVLEEQTADRSRSWSSTSTAEQPLPLPWSVHHLRQKVGVNSTANVMISMRPRNIAAVQIQV